MKATVGGWTLDADIVRSLGSNPHTVDVTIDARSLDGHISAELTLTPATADALGGLLDEVGSALRDCAVAGSCSRCGRPCDPGERLCPDCEDQR